MFPHNVLILVPAFAALASCVSLDLFYAAAAQARVVEYVAFINDYSKNYNYDSAKKQSEAILEHFRESFTPLDPTPQNLRGFIRKFFLRDGHHPELADFAVKGGTALYHNASAESNLILDAVEWILSDYGNCIGEKHAQEDCDKAYMTSLKGNATAHQVPIGNAKDCAAQERAMSRVLFLGSNSVDLDKDKATNNAKTSMLEFLSSFECDSARPEEFEFHIRGSLSDKVHPQVVEFLVKGGVELYEATLKDPTKLSVEALDALESLVSEYGKCIRENGAKEDCEKAYESSLTGKASEFKVGTVDTAQRRAQERLLSRMAYFAHFSVHFNEGAALAESRKVLAEVRRENKYVEATPEKLEEAIHQLFLSYDGKSRLLELAVKGGLDLYNAALKDPSVVTNPTLDYMHYLLHSYDACIERPEKSCSARYRATILAYAAKNGIEIASAKFEAAQERVIAKIGFVESFSTDYDDDKANAWSARCVKYFRDHNMYVEPTPQNLGTLIRRFYRDDQSALILTDYAVQGGIQMYEVTLADPTKKSSHILNVMEKMMRAYDKCRTGLHYPRVCTERYSSLRERNAHLLWKQSR